MFQICYDGSCYVANVNDIYLFFAFICGFLFFGFFSIVGDLSEIIFYYRRKKRELRNEEKDKKYL